jgi:hypothetical protein
LLKFFFKSHHQFHYVEAVHPEFGWQELMIRDGVNELSNELRLGVSEEPSLPVNGDAPERPPARGTVDRAKRQAARWRYNSTAAVRTRC